VQFKQTTNAPAKEYLQSIQRSLCFYVLRHADSEEDNKQLKRLSFNSMRMIHLSEVI